MGLDMYACTVPAGTISKPVDFVDDITVMDKDECRESRECVQGLFYWRKCPDLHGWMEKLYREKGGRDQDFNCAPVQLTMEDIERLEADILSDSLPKTQGFFFGASDTEADKPTHLEFVAKAKAALYEDLEVYYDSWW